MKIKITFFFLLTLFIASTLSLSTAFAQYEPHTQIGLPEGAKVRFGTGDFRRIQYAPNGTGTQFFVFSTIGIWLYDAETLQVRDLIEDFSGYSSVAFNPDGSTLAAGFYDGTVKLWNVSTGTFYNTSIRHDRPVWSVRFSPDDSVLATKYSYDVMHLWDVSTGNLRSTLTGPTGIVEVEYFSFSPDGQTLATWNWSDKVVYLWDVSTGNFRNTLSVNPKKDNVSFSLDGQILATVNNDNTIELWDVFRGNRQNILEHDFIIGPRSITNISFSPDGRTLITQSSPDGLTLITQNDFSVYLWDVAAGELRNALNGHRSGETGAILSPNGNILVTKSGDMFHLWDVATGTHRNTLKGHNGVGRFTRFSQDGRILATAGRDGTVMLWDVATGTHRNTLKGHNSDILGMHFSPNGDTLAIMDTAEVCWWDVATGTRRDTFMERFAWETYIIGFSSDKDPSASGNSHLVFLTDVTTGALRRTLGDSIWDISVSSDENTVAIIWGEIQLWDTATGTRRATIIEPREPPPNEFPVIEPSSVPYTNSVSFSPDSSTVATASYAIYNPLDSLPPLGIVDPDANGAVRLWDATTGQLKTTLDNFPEGMSGVYSVSFSPDGQTLASGGQDGWVHLWDVATGSLRNTFHNPGDHIYSVRFSPNEQILATGGARGVSFWDVSTGIRREVHQSGGGVYSVSYNPDGLLQFGSDVYSVNFSSDGLLFAAGGQSGRVHLWNVVDILAGTSTSDKVFSGHGTNIDSVSFTPDGNTLVSRDWHGMVFLWDVGSVGTPQLKADVNGDGVVNIQDMVMVASQFGQIGESNADVNGDGIVNIVDLLLVAAAFGDIPAAPTLRHPTNEFFNPEVVQQWLAAAKRLALTDAMTKRGIAILEAFLTALTPKETALLPNYPNPFNPETWIPYQLAKPSDVSVSIYATDGKLVRTLKLGQQAAGIYASRNRAAYWDGKNEVGEAVASGVYFYTLKAGGFTATRKMLIRK
ncbi:hypothetical protein C6503_10205 [Candidatus Poribacteria bacterium]|nr:MAG: hypothetical protein C6503_10205 [Candidatus Poribacteria bacterium]